MATYKDTIPLALGRQVNDIVHDLIDKASAHSGKQIPRPRIYYTVRGVIAGESWPSINVIKLNPVFLLEQTQNMLSNTVPHEVAHHVAHHVFGAGCGHNRQWKKVMYFFGLIPSRCHQYDITNARVKKPLAKFSYSCRCGTRDLTIVRHRRILKGRTKYQCRSCKSTLTYQPNQEGITMETPKKKTTEQLKKTKAAQAKKRKTSNKKKTTAAKPKKKATGYKGHRAGTYKEAAHKFFDEKKPEKKGFLKYCENQGLAPSTASSWFHSFGKK